MSNATASSPAEVGRRAHRGWLTPGAVLVGAIGTVGVALGYSGYRDLHPTASVWDALYSALQLLTLNADATPDAASTPVALNVGRFLCALASASTLGLILVRLVLGADRLRLWISRDYVLVFGSTVAARKLAEAAAAKSRRARPWSCRAVLVGRSHSTTATDRWRTGLVVVDPQQPDAVARLVGSAREIIVAENDDADGLVMMSNSVRLSSTAMFGCVSFCSHRCWRDRAKWSWPEPRQTSARRSCRSLRRRRNV